MTPIEQQRVRDGIRTAKWCYTTHAWRFYFSYLQGRAVTLQETDEFLRAEKEEHVERVR